MKTIFITMADPMTVRNIFRTPFWSNFCQSQQNTRIVVLVTPEKKDYYAKTFAQPNVVFESVTPEWTTRLSRVLGTIARSSVNSHTNLWSKMRSYLRGESSLFATTAKRLFTALIGNSDGFKALLRKAFLRLLPNAEVRRLFESYKPDMVISTYIVSFTFDIPISIEAKRRGIRVVGMTRSWDSLSSHGMLRIIPDLLVTQNVFLKNMALQYQGFSKTKTPIEIIGLPHYDAYIDPTPLIEPREEFFRKIGLDPNKKLLLYGAMGDFLFPNEGRVAFVLEDLIKNNLISHDVQVLYRAHPKFQSPLEKMRTLSHVLPDRGATYHTKNMSSFEMEANDEKRLINSIYHADIVITAGSTFAIDAAALDKPIICIGFDEKKDGVPYWESVERFYDSYTHFEALLETQGVQISRSPSQLAQHINEYLSNPSKDRTGRRAIIDLLVAPFDGRSSRRLTELLNREVSKLVS